MNEDNEKSTPETEPTPEILQSSSRPQPATLPLNPAPPSGTGYASPPPAKKRHPLLTCFVICGVFAFLFFIALSLFALVFSSAWQNRPPLIRSSNVIGFVRIEDAIMDGSRTLQALEYFTKNRDIEAVLIRVDSPGGAVGTSQEIFEAIKKLKARKKVIVSMGNVAASGGYYVSCAADEIYSNPGTLTGSIGVILGLVNAQDLAKKVGISYEPIKSGKFKDIGSMARPVTEEERKLLDGVIKDTYNQFVEAILSQRKTQIQKALADLPKKDPAVAAVVGAEATPEALLRAIADGRIFTGRQALTYGLVDKIGTQNDAMKRAGELIGISKPELYEYKPRRSLREMIESGAESAIAGPLRKVRLEYSMP